MMRKGRRLRGAGVEGEEQVVMVSEEGVLVWLGEWVGPGGYPHCPPEADSLRVAGVDPPTGV